MAEILEHAKPLAASPLKESQLAGASLDFHGIAFEFLEAKAILRLLKKAGIAAFRQTYPIEFETDCL